MNVLYTKKFKCYFNCCLALFCHHFLVLLFNLSMDVVLHDLRLPYSARFMLMLHFIYFWGIISVDHENEIYEHISLSLSKGNLLATTLND